MALQRQPGQYAGPGGGGIALLTNPPELRGMSGGTGHEWERGNYHKEGNWANKI